MKFVDRMALPKDQRPGRQLDAAIAKSTHRVLTKHFVTDTGACMSGGEYHNGRRGAIKGARTTRKAARREHADRVNPHRGSRGEAKHRGRILDALIREYAEKDRLLADEIARAQ